MIQSARPRAPDNRRKCEGLSDIAGMTLLCTTLFVITKTTPKTVATFSLVVVDMKLFSVLELICEGCHLAITVEMAIMLML